MTCANCTECPFREERAFFLNYHEIHITVENVKSGPFRRACELIGVKPVLIAMQDKSDETFAHLMTSKTFKGSESEAIKESIRQEIEFLNLGMHVSRIKIETSPSNPIASEVNDGQYFETHVPLIIQKSMSQTRIRSLVRDIAAATQTNARLSRNAFKDNAFEDTMTWMVTYRDRVSYPKFATKTSKLVYQLSKLFSVGKVITEFAWFDTNEQLDKNWR